MKYNLVAKNNSKLDISISKYLNKEELNLINKLYPYTITIPYKNYGIGEDLTKFINNKEAIIILTHEWSLTKPIHIINKCAILCFKNKQDYIEIKILL